MGVEDNILCGFYLALWVLTFIWYQLKNHSLDAGSAIIGSYILYAVFSLFSINDYMFNWRYEPLRFWPYVYLYIMLMIALVPTISMHVRPVKTINEPHTRVIKWLSIAIIISAILIIPTIMANFSDGLVKLFMDSDAGKDAYQEQLEGASDAGSAISNLPAIFYNMFSDIAIFLAYYYICQKKRSTIIVLGLLMSVVIGILVPIMSGQRGSVIMCLFTIIMGYMLFKQFMPKNIVKYVRIAGMGFLFVLMLPVAAITSSRYSETNAGITGYITWYIGQGSVYFNNSALDAGGIRNGDRTINLIKRVIDSRNTPKNYTERRDKYHNLRIDDYYFTTFVGDFTLDFGPVIPVFIFVLFNFWVLINIKPRDGTLDVHQLLLIYFTMCVCMQGGMTLFSYSDTGNLKIVAFAGLYTYLRYHNALLKYFPKVSGKEKTDEKDTKNVG